MRALGGGGRGRYRFRCGWKNESREVVYSHCRCGLVCRRGVEKLE